MNRKQNFIAIFAIALMALGTSLLFSCNADDEEYDFNGAYTMANGVMTRNGDAYNENVFTRVCEFKNHSMHFIGVNARAENVSFLLLANSGLTKFKCYNISLRSGCSEESSSATLYETQPSDTTNVCVSVSITIREGNSRMTGNEIMTIRKCDFKQ